MKDVADSDACNPAPHTASEAHVDEPLERKARNNKPKFPLCWGVGGVPVNRARPRVWREGRVGKVLALQSIRTSV